MYIRVSTDDQTTDNQIPDLKRMALERGYEIVEIYSENETAWKRGHQHELARAINDGIHKRYDVFMIWALDRLSRQGLWVTLGLVKQLWDSGIKVVSPQDSWIETDNELVRDCMMAMRASMAKHESDERSARTKAGMTRAKAQGIDCTRRGRPDRGHRAKRSDVGGHHRYKNVRSEQTITQEVEK